MHSDVLIGKLQVRDLIDIATGEKVPNIYIDTKLSELDVRDHAPPHPQSRLERVLRHPVRSAKRALARLPGLGAGRVGAS
jgi:hypothetical protein